MAPPVLVRSCGFVIRVFCRNVGKFQGREYSTAKISIKEVMEISPIGKKIRVQGWVKAMRKQKENTFLDIGDGLCSKTLQVITKSSSLPGGINYGCSVEIIGELMKSTHPAQPFELQSESIQVIGPCKLEVGLKDKTESHEAGERVRDYPIHPKEIQSHDFTRQYLHLRPRTKTFSSLLRVRSAFYFAVHEFFQKHHFIHIDTPILTTNDCEGAGEVFHIKPTIQKTNDSPDAQDDFFDSDVFLTISAQFHLEAMACALSSVYTMGPTFRAENSRTRHHLAEFHMLEAETVVPSLPPLLELIEDLVKSVTIGVLEKCPDDVSFLHKQTKHKIDLENCIAKPYIRMTYTEAINILEKNQSLEPIKWGQDLSKQHERYLVSFCENIPVFVTDYPAAIKPFYMKIGDENLKTVEAVDLLVSEVGELCGGSIREHRFDELSRRINHLGLEDSLQWYLDLRRFGTVPHGGFGLGVERYLQWVLGIYNIKDTIAFPRWTHHCQH